MSFFFYCYLTKFENWLKYLKRKLKTAKLLLNYKDLHLSNPPNTEKTKKLSKSTLKLLLQKLTANLYL